MDLPGFLPSFLPAFVAALALLTALILALAAGVKRLHRISGWIFGPAGIIGLLLYLAAFLWSAFQATGPASPGRALLDAARAVLRAVYATCAMFIGRQEYGEVEKLLKAQGGAWFYAGDLLFWLTHLGALFVTASAVLSTLGKKLLQALRMRLLFFRRDHLYLIFGLHHESLVLGRDLAKEAGAIVFYVDSRPPEDLAEQAVAFGAVVRQDAPLLDDRINERLMRMAGMRRDMRLRSARLLILGPEERFNITLAQAAIAYWEGCGIPPERACVDLRCGQEVDTARFKRFESEGGNRYDVNAFCDAELSARLLVHESPPSEVMDFGEDGMALNDFHALVIGFGQVGQSTLKQLILNGQFYGSRFSADIVDVAAGRITGQFRRRHPALEAAYNLRFHELDVRSDAFYQKLDEWVKTLRYIVICLGNDDMNYELAADLERYFDRFEEKDKPVIVVNVCDRRYVLSTDKEHIRFFEKQSQVYSGAIFRREMADNMAKAVNLSYFEQTQGVFDPQEAWRRSDYFSRSSSRASADFIPAMVKMAGLTLEEAADRAQFACRIRPRSALLESLGITEHLRWNAFHFVRGYTAMPLDEVRARAAAGVKPFHKDPDLHKHACLVPWEELDAVSKTVGALTGNPKLDYKDMDIKNVLEIPRTLAAKRDIDLGVRRKREDKGGAAREPKKGGRSDGGKDLPV